MKNGSMTIDILISLCISQQVIVIVTYFHTEFLDTFFDLKQFLNLYMVRYHFENHKQAIMFDDNYHYVEGARGLSSPLLSD